MYRNIKLLSFLTASFLFYVAGLQPVYAQTCVTNSITINTGYNPNTGTAVTAPSANGSTPVQDPKWTVSAISSIMTSTVTETNTEAYSTWWPSGGTYDVASISSPADVVTLLPASPGNWATVANMDWISCLNSNFIVTDASSDYSMTLSRTFNMAYCGTVNISLGVASDNYISSVTLDGGSIGFTAQTPGAEAAYTYSFSPVTQNAYSLSCGAHTISIVVHNYDQSAGFANGMGLGVYGTITSVSPANSLVSETSSCSGYTTCTLPAITGSVTGCYPGTIDLSDAVTGGSWSSSNSALPVSSAGIISPTAAGTSTVTYTYGCASTTYTVTASPSVTSSITINTGYNPNTSSAVTAPSSNGITPVPDPKWNVAGISSIMTSTVTETNTEAYSTWWPSGGTYDVASIGSSADVVPLLPASPGNWATATNMDWISCLNSNFIVTDASSDYSMTLTRTFYMAYCGTVDISLGVASDNYISSFTLDGSSIGFTPQTAGAEAAYTYSFTPVVQNSYSLSCGAHTFSVVVHNYDQAAGFANGMGLGVYGTVTSVSPANSIVSETAPCNSYVPCTIPAITGATSSCFPGTITLSDVVGGGTWTSSNGSLPISTAGIITPAATGTSTVTYTYGCASATYVVTVNATPTPSITPTPSSMCEGATISEYGAAGGGVSFLWTASGSDPGMTFSAATSQSTTVTNATGTGTTTITFSSTGSDGCVGTASFAITVVAPPAFTPTFAATPLSTLGTLCSGSSSWSLHWNTPSTPTAGDTYSWSGPSSFSSTSANPSMGTASTSQGGNYTLTVTNSSGCTTTHVMSVSVVGEPNVCVSSNDPPAGDPPYSLTCSPTEPVTVVYETGVSESPFPAAGFVPGSITTSTVSPSSWPYSVPTFSGDAIEIVSYSLYGCVWTSPNCWAAQQWGEGGRMSQGVNIQSAKETGNIRLVPNPNSGVFTIEGALVAGPDEKEAQVELVNEIGQKVYTDVAAITNGGISKQVSMNINLPNGIYILRVKSANDNQLIRFVLNR